MRSASLENPAPPSDRGHGRLLLDRPELVILAALLPMVAVFAAMRPDAFLSVINIRNMAMETGLMMLLAIGRSYVIVTAGIDLTVGAVLVFSGVCSVLAMRAVGVDDPLAPWVGLLVAIIADLAWGALNGGLIAQANLPPRNVTLATMGMVLHRTRFGLHTFAVGSDPQGGERAGINVARHLMRNYMISGLCTGTAGYLTLSRFASTTIAGHAMDNLKAITAVVLGGASLFGGSGTLMGTGIGVPIPVVLASGLVIMGLPSFWQEVAVGIVLLAALRIDQWRRSRRTR